MHPRTACKFIVGLLYLAATEACESALAQMVIDKIHAGDALSLVALQAQFKKNTTTPSLPVVIVEQHSLIHYDQLIPKYQEVSYV